ncbi:MAG: hypothetical protein WBY94_12250 [Polyangiaceae bacterium]
MGTRFDPWRFCRVQCQEAIARRQLDRVEMYSSSSMRVERKHLPSVQNM